MSKFKNTDYFCAESFKGLEEIFVEELKKVTGGAVEIVNVFQGFV